MSDDLPAEFVKPVRLAGAALAAAQASKWPAAYRYVKRINDECGEEAVELALRAWIDTYVDHATDGDTRPKRGRIGFLNGQDGKLENDDAERIPERIKWAGRLIQARAALDEAAYIEILEELPEEGLQVGEFVAAVLEVCAQTINGLPRGFASREARERWAES